MRPAGVLREAPFRTERLPAGALGAPPAKLVEVSLRDLDAVVGRPEPGQRAVQLDLVPALAERGGKHGTTAKALHVPRGGPDGNAFKRAVARQHGCGRF